MPNAPRIPGHEPAKFLGWLCGEMGGEIHLARRETDHALVALRVSPGEPPGTQVERLALQRRLRHPNILAVVEIGKAEGLWYLALEDAAPGTLARRLQKGRLPWPEALRLTGGLASALQHARDQGLVCGPLSLDSISLAEYGVARLGALDFQAPSTSALLASSGGGVALMPPEWLDESDREATPAADVYRLGAVMYAALEGFPPFAGESSAVVARQILTRAPRPLRRRFWRKAPESVAAIGMKCLARSPQDRYATPGDLALVVSSSVAALGQ